MIDSTDRESVTPAGTVHANATITDDDAVVVEMVTGPSHATEGSTTSRAIIDLFVHIEIADNAHIDVPVAFTGGVLGEGFVLDIDPSQREGLSISGSTATLLRWKSGLHTYVSNYRIYLSALPDEDSENEIITVQIPEHLGENVTGITGYPHTITIHDSESEPAQATVEFTRKEFKAFEKSTNHEAIIFVTLNKAINRDVTAHIITQDGTAIGGDMRQGGVDYQGGTYTATIPAGLTFGAVFIPLRDDDIPENDETFEILIDSTDLPNVTPSGNTSATVTIEDRDPADMHLRAMRSAAYEEHPMTGGTMH